MDVIVTGGSSGIGLATALEYAKRGNDVAIIARGKEKLVAAIEQMKAVSPREDAKFTYATADLSNEEECIAAFNLIFDAGFVPYLLINCAGIVVPGRFIELTSEEFARNVNLDLFGTVHACRCCIPRMIEQGKGHIVNTSSVAGYMGVYGYSGYSSAKFGVLGFSEVLRFEMKPHNIKVSVVCPPDTDTPGLAYERKVRPIETDVVAGTLKAVPPEVIAKAIVKGTEKGKYRIIPGFISKFYRFLKENFTSLYFAIVDSDIKKAQKLKKQ